MPTDTTPAPVDLDALGAIVAKATPGPWRSNDADGDRWISGTPREGEKIRHWSDPDPGTVLSRECDGEDYYINLSDEDRAAIVALRNAWPDIEREMRLLREVAEAAQSYCATEPPCHCGELAPGPCCPACRTDRELRAALSRLDSMKGGK